MGAYFVVLFGTAITVLGGIIMLLWYLIFGLSVAAFMVPMMLIAVAGAMLMGGGAGGAIEPFPEIAGIASAVFGSCEFVFAFVVSTVVLAWKVRSTFSLSITLIVLSSIAFIACLLCYKKKP